MSTRTILAFIALTLAAALLDKPEPGFCAGQVYVEADGIMICGGVR